MAQIAVAFLLLVAGVGEAAGPLRVNGSTTVNPVAADAADVLRTERHMTIQVDTQGGSSGGIAGIGGNDEARTKVSSTRGAITQLSASWADEKAPALSIKLDDGRVVAPVAAEIVMGRYPMARPLFFVTNGPPRGDAKALIDYVLSP